MRLSAIPHQSLAQLLSTGSTQPTLLTEVAPEEGRSSAGEPSRASLAGKCVNGEERHLDSDANPSEAGSHSKKSHRTKGSSKKKRKCSAKSPPTKRSKKNPETKVSSAGDSSQTPSSPPATQNLADPQVLAAAVAQIMGAASRQVSAATSTENLTKTEVLAVNGNQVSTAAGTEADLSTKRSLCTHSKEKTSGKENPSVTSSAKRAKKNLSKTNHPDALLTNKTPGIKDTVTETAAHISLMYCQNQPPGHAKSSARSSGGMNFRRTYI